MSKQVIFDYAGKNFFVTGASSGMGKKVVQELAEAGAKVLAIARNKERLQELKQEWPAQVVPVAVADLKDMEAVTEAVNSFVQEYGKFAGVVHAAGIDGLTPIKTYDDELAEQIMDISFWSAMRLVRLLQKKKYTEDGASFVLFSSIAAKTGEKALFAYSSAKAAVSTAIKALAKELCRRRLRFNAVLPGRVHTPMTAESENPSMEARHLFGVGEPENVSGVVLFLLSDRSQWITGTNVVVDGGYLAN